MKPFFTLSGSSLLLVLVAFAAAQAPRPATPPPATPTKPEARYEDRTAIIANDAAFVKAFNAGDAEGLAATFTEDAEVTDEENEVLEGRAAIAGRFASYFAASPGAKITLKTESLKYLGPEAALLRGRAVVAFADGGEPDTSRYTVVFVKRDGKWLQASSRDEREEPATSEEHLKAVEWLVGDWVSESEDSVAHWSCRWAENKNFLLVTFDLRTAGKHAMSGTQRIGWDPLNKQFRSWVFDSEGGYGEGRWSHDGDRWLVKANGVRHDGRPASATQVITRQGKDVVHWTSVDRTVAGKVAPEVDAFTLVRRPPGPPAGTKK